MTRLVAVRWSLPSEEGRFASSASSTSSSPDELEAYLMEPLSDRESPFVEVGWTP